MSHERDVQAESVIGHQGFETDHQSIASHFERELIAAREVNADLLAALEDLADIADAAALHLNSSMMDEQIERARAEIAKATMTAPQPAKDGGLS